jgi:glycosyltransferase involved in cell wall biosynthesis
MRILIDATAANSGGKIYLNQLLAHLAPQAEGHEFIIFHLGDFENFKLPPSQSEFRFERVSLPFHGSWIGSAILKMFWRLFLFPAHLQRLNPDLLFSNAGFGSGWGMYSGRIVMALHNSMPLRRELFDQERSMLRRQRLVLLRRLMHKAIRRSDASIVFSEDTKRRLKENFGDLHREPHVVYHGIDWGAHERSRRPDALPGLPSPYLLYVSQFHRYKNVLRLIEAFAVLLRTRPELSLVLVGELIDREYWREIEARVAELGIKDRIRHVPQCDRETLVGMYQNALIFVQPSLAETCSFPLLEAMAMGTPIAAAGESALPEMAADAAVYFDPYNVDEIATVLEQLIHDEALRKRLSRNGIARAEAFSWEETARKTLAIFEQAI